MEEEEEEEEEDFLREVTLTDGAGKRKEAALVMKTNAPAVTGRRFVSSAAP